MKTNRYITAVTILLLAGSGSAFAEIERIVNFQNQSPSPICENVHTLIQGRSARLTISGEWTDFTNNVTSTLGVTGTRNSSVAKPPSVTVDLRAAPNATPGRRNVTLHYPIGKDTFQVLVREPQRVDSIAASAEPTSTFTRLSLDVRGANLPASLTAAVIPTTINGGFDTSILAGGVTGVQITRQNAVPISTTRARIDLEFAQPMEKAVLQVQLSGSDPCFGGFRFGFPNSFVSPNTNNILIVEAQNVDTRNFVTDIRIDQSTPQPSVGNPVTLLLTLKNPVAYPKIPTIPLPKAGSFGSQKTGPGETIYFKLIPGASFSINGQPVNENQYRTVVAAPGQREVRITALATACPVRGNVSAARFTIQTAMHNINAQSPPERVDRSFTIACPDNN